MKKVVSIVFNNFLHDSRVLKEAISLKKAGYAPVVVAMHEANLPEKEEVAGIPVHRIRLKTRQWSKNRFIQLFKYAELFYRIARHYRRADIFHVNDDGPLPMAVLIKWFLNRRALVVYDAHELEFDKNEANSNYYPTPVRALAERIFIRHADAILTVSPLIADAYVQRYRIPRPEIVMNCPPYEEQPGSEDLFRKAFGIGPDPKIFLYQGGLIPNRGVELLLEVFQHLDQNHVLVFLGFGPLVPLVEEKAKRHANIFFHPAVSPTELHRYTASADFGFCLYQGISGNHNLTIGNKIFQYIMAGVPMLASDLAGLRHVLKSPNMGLVLEDFRDPERVKQAILQIGSWKKEDYLPALKQAAREYNWENQEKVLLDVYKRLG